MSIPWTAILEIIIKITLWIMGKNEQTIESKKKFYEFVAHMDSYIPLRLKDDARRQVAMIREEQRLAEVKANSEKEELHAYKKAYEAKINEVRNRCDD